MKERQSQFFSKFSATLASSSLPAYDDFLSSWQKLVENNDSKPFHHEYKHIEQFAITALSRLVQESHTSSSGFITSPLFDSLHNSAVICGIDGQIGLANQQAEQHYGLMQGMVLNQLNIKLKNGQSFNTTLRDVLDDKASQNSLSLLQCYIQDEACLTPMVVMNLNITHHAAPQALIIFMDAACNKETLKIIAGKFSLTRTETAVLSAFSQGTSLRDIAKIRHRSYVTIRNQFQSILAKTGCTHQTDLLRILLGVSYLLSYTEIVSLEDDASKIGKKVEIPRVGGRFVDIKLYGKLDGKPVIVLPSIFGMPITTEIEQLLVSRSILMIGVWQPGFGDTTIPLGDDDLYQCLADDIATIMTTMGIEQCPLMGRASAARSVVNLVRLIPERISRACVVNSLVPLPYLIRHKMMSRWTASLVSASQYSPTVAALILETGKKMMLRNGIQHFLRKMYSGSATDVASINTASVATSIHEGVHAITKQGIASSKKVIEAGFMDWSNEVHDLPKKVTLLQGKRDPHIPMAASRQFAADFPECIALVEFADGGGLLNYTHADDIFEWLFAP